MTTLDFMMGVLLSNAKPITYVKRERRWSPKEVEFLRKNIGKLSHEEIGLAIGRSTNAVKIYQVRHGIHAPSKRPGFLSTNKAAKQLGIEPKSLMNLYNHGRIELQDAPVDRKFMVIRKKALYRWAVRPENWVYFKADRIQDKHLKRLVMRAQSMWDDKWLTIGEAAEQLGYGNDTRLVNVYIHRGKIKGAIQWGNWWVLESSIKDLVIFRGKGGNRREKAIRRVGLQRIDMWFIRAKYVENLSYVGIAARTPGWSAKRIERHMNHLRRLFNGAEGLLEELKNANL